MAHYVKSTQDKKLYIYPCSFIKVEGVILLFRQLYYMRNSFYLLRLAFYALFPPNSSVPLTDNVIKFFEHFISNFLNIFLSYHTVNNTISDLICWSDIFLSGFVNVFELEVCSFACFTS